MAEARPAGKTGPRGPKPADSWGAAVFRDSTALLVLRLIGTVPAT
jgi:hypothetical protein